MKWGALLSDDNVSWSEESDVGIIRLNRPDKLNALTQAMMEDIRQICHDVRDRGDIKAVLLLGNGRAFCAGQDLKESGSEEPVMERLAREFRGDAQSALSELPQPTIAGIHGHALGRGLMLALACDIRIASEDAMFGFPEVKFGIIPGGGGTQRLAKVIGPSRALHMVLTGENVAAGTAYQWGLITKMVPSADLENEAISLAAGIASLPGAAGIFSKVTIGVASNTVLSEGVKFEKTLSAVLTSGADWKRERDNFGKK